MSQAPAQRWPHASVRAGICAALAATPGQGLRARDIAKAMNVPPKKVYNALYRLESQHVVTRTRPYVGQGPGCMWFIDPGFPSELALFAMPSSRTSKVVEALHRSDAGLTALELMTRLNLSSKQIDYTLHPLKRRGLVVSSGSRLGYKNRLFRVWKLQLPKGES